MEFTQINLAKRSAKEYIVRLYLLNENTKKELNIYIFVFTFFLLVTLRIYES